MIDEIVSIEEIACASARYDITVADNNNFYANGVLVHNCQNLVSEIFQTKDQLVEFDVTDMSQETIEELERKGVLRFIPPTGWVKVNKSKADPNARYEVTLKMDGSSCTVFARRQHLEDGTPTATSGVCSRNLQLKVNEANAGNTFIRVATKSRLLEALEEMAREDGSSFAVQAELVGEGIQGNQEKIKGHQLFVFDIFDIDRGEYLTPAERKAVFNRLVEMGVQISHVPVLHENTSLQELQISKIEDLLKFADGPSYNPSVKREGVVFKRTDGAFSFKVISNAWLLNGGN